MIRKYVENAKMQLKIHEIFFPEQKSLLALCCLHKQNCNGNEIAEISSPTKENI